MLELQRLSRQHFAWQWLPATGHSWGILLGVREDAFSVEDMDRGEFFVSMAVTDRRVHLSWEVIIVYGPTDHSRSADFLAELKNKVERCTTPVVVADDFNLIQWASDKSSLNVDQPRMRLFNDCIADLALLDVWHHYGKLARQSMKGWGANLGTDLRARKWALLGQLKALDDLADGPGLSPDD
ncbi:hypothetical protein D1007_27980 [Hordeum vulgare]|nr:hypothetical protein D1007_27980 [Hordeum vulgare]